MEPPEPTTADERPELVTVLGWLWTGIGVFLTLAALFALTVRVSMRPLFPDAELERIWIREAGGPGWAEPAALAVDWMFRHLDLVLALQLAACLAVLTGGVFLLLRRRWARALLELLSWLGLASLLASGVLTLIVFRGLFAGFEGAPGGGQPLPFFDWLIVAGAALNLLFYGVPLAVLLYLLRRPAVRRAVASGGGSGRAGE